MILTYSNYINRAPIADFDWMPKPLWEGDVFQSINMSTDPDGDALSYYWHVEQPDGIVMTFNSKDFNYRFLSQGIYIVTLTVSDGRLTNTVTKRITAQPLTIHSNVTYTDNWMMLHTKKGHQTSTPPKQFYSGEIFIVSTQSSPAPVEDVSAWMDTVGLDGISLYVTEQLATDTGDGTTFIGELFHPKFQSFTEGLPQGLQFIHFRIRYRNGVVKTEEIPVEIIGNVQQSVGVHRVQ